MQLQSTFGAFLVALTMVHGAPLLVERHRGDVAGPGNMTANANPSGAGSNFRAGGDGFGRGRMQDIEGDAPSAGGDAGNGRSDDNGGFDQVGGPGGEEGSGENGGSDEVGGSTESGDSTGSGDSGEDGGSNDNAGSGEGTGSDNTGGSNGVEPGKRSEANKAKKVQRGSPIGETIAEAAASIAKTGGKVTRRQDPTGQAIGNSVPQGDGTGTPPEAQSSGDDTPNTSRTSQDNGGGPSGQRKGPSEPPADGDAPVKSPESPTDPDGAELCRPGQCQR